MENPSYENTENNTLKSSALKQTSGSKENYETALTQTSGSKENYETSKKSDRNEIYMKKVLNEDYGTMGEEHQSEQNEKSETLDQNSGTKLERRLGLFSGTMIIVGTMIGSGIFVSPTGVLRSTGSVGLSLIIWLAGGIYSLCGALSYAELGCLIPSSGGEYAYYKEAFKGKNKKTTTLNDIPVFLFAWAEVLVLNTSSLAVLSMISAKYIYKLSTVGCFVPDGNETNEQILATKLIAAAIIMLITFINAYSVKWAMKVQNIFTMAKLSVIALIIVGGIVKLLEKDAEKINFGFEGSTPGVGAIATAFYSGLWAYGGWNNLNYVTEELIDPYKNLPRAIMIALPLVTICYLCVNVSYLTVMNTGELLASDTVAVLFGSRLFGSFGEIFMIIAVACSAFGSANGGSFTASRLCFVAARGGHMMDILSYVHVERLTPTAALIFHASIAIVMVIPTDIWTLIRFLSFTSSTFIIGAMLALLLMRYTKKYEHRPYKVPIVIPVFVLLMAIYLVIGPIADAPRIEYLYAMLFLLAGLIFYFPFIKHRKSLPGMSQLKLFVQLTLQVVKTNEPIPP